MTLPWAKLWTSRIRGPQTTVRSLPPLARLVFYDLISFVNGGPETRTVHFQGAPHEVGPGEAVTSSRALARYVGVDRKTVERTLALLASGEDPTITLTKTPGWTRVSFNNWAEYQDQRAREGAAQGAREGAREGATTIEEEGDGERKQPPRRRASGRAVYQYPDRFEKLWRHYPTPNRGGGKGKKRKALTVYQSLHRDLDANESVRLDRLIWAGISVARKDERYQADGWESLPDFERFLSGRLFDSLNEG